MKRSMNPILTFLLSAILLALFLVWWNQDRLIFFPEKLPENFTFDFPNEFQEIKLNTPDGETSYALYFPSKSNVSKKTVLFFHGNAGSLRTWGRICEDFLPLGWNILITDYRGYGKNSGSISEKSMNADAELWLDYLLREIKVPRNEIVIYGRSIGTGVATDLAFKNPDLTLFLETPFTDLPTLAQNYYPFLQTWMLRFQFRNLNKLETVRSKIRIFHGTEDEIIPYSNSEVIFKKLKERNQDAILFTIPNGSHNDLTFYPEYHRALKKSLDEIR
ncbi:alpha/beta hydrolase [Leptospira santarosai]|uniref:alpha/beta hydrolase n=1 Tax=Leptospira santarosai TaxID=28183 RepID=UPI0002E64A07|nr:alpha/beta hydrolase [Leptospira santarosai]